MLISRDCSEVYANKSNPKQLISRQGLLATNNAVTSLAAAPTAKHQYPGSDKENKRQSEEALVHDTK